MTSSKSSSISFSKLPSAVYRLLWDNGVAKMDGGQTIMDLVRPSNTKTNTKSWWGRRSLTSSCVDEEEMEKLQEESEHYDDLLPESDSEDDFQECQVDDDNFDEDQVMSFTNLPSKIMNKNDGDDATQATAASSSLSSYAETCRSRYDLDCSFSSSDGKSSALDLDDDDMSKYSLDDASSVVVKSKRSWLAKQRSRFRPVPKVSQVEIKPVVGGSNSVLAGTW